MYRTAGAAAVTRSSKRSTIPILFQDDGCKRLTDCNGNCPASDGSEGVGKLGADGVPVAAKGAPTPARCGPYCDGKGRPLLLSYHEAPPYLQFNPFIQSGYRGYLSTKMCIERCDVASPRPVSSAELSSQRATA